MNCKLVVIADDLTGAAEMAGVAWRHGLKVRLSLGIPNQLTACDVWVIATNTRQMNVQEAEETTRQLLRQLTHTVSFASKETAQSGDTTLLFKKIDSVLRGHIVEEIEVAMQETGYGRALLLPQNPSRKRIIKQGIYTLNDTPLHQTAFANDPEFPATTSEVEQLLPKAHSLPLNQSLKEGINVGDAATNCELNQQLCKADAKTLLAGAADALRCLLPRLFGTSASNPKDSSAKTASKAFLHQNRRLFVLGSTLSRPQAIAAQLPEITVSCMPDDVFRGSDATAWIDQLKATYRLQSSLLICIGHPSEGGRDYAIRLRTVMAQAVLALVASVPPQQLIIEGGATAWATLHELGWLSFKVCCELAPGIVSLLCHDTAFPTNIILKPGSYPWGDCLQRF